MFFWIESGLVVLAVGLAYTAPNLGSRQFERAEDLLCRLGERRTSAVVAVGLTALAARAALLPILPIPQPGGHDEFCYLLLADTFAHGRLTNPTHPMWIHFESFHIIWQPTYTAMFYPAQGLVMALGQVIMGHPFWGVWLSVSLMCAAICWMLQGWLPPGWALLGGFLAVIRFGTFNYWVNSYFGGAVAATGGALVLGALPRVKRSQRVRDTLLMGLGFAMVASSRPYEGLFFGLLVGGLLVAWTYRMHRPSPKLEGAPSIGRLSQEGETAPSFDSLRSEESTKAWWKHVIVPLALALVLTGLAMGYYFWRTTGSPWVPPYLVNLRTYNPVPNFPWQPLRPMPVYRHESFREYYVNGTIARYKMQQTLSGMVAVILNVPLTFSLFYLGPALALPLLMAWAKMPHGFSWKSLSPNTRFLLLLCGVATVTPMLPLRATWFLVHHAAPVTSAVLALVLLAMRRLRSQTGRHPEAGLFITRAVPIICLVMLVVKVSAKPLRLPEARPWLEGGAPTWCALIPSNQERAATLAEFQRYPGRHLAIVRYGPHHDVFFHEWVYNQADIDAAKVVWARDMGPDKNKELLDYFPDRHAWLVEADDTPPKLLPYRSAR